MAGHPRIRKAVFPVAGLGTRFLPATKTVPKEMLPVIDRPLIQYAVDEALEAGCDTLVFVTNRYKHAVADYFDKAYELEQKLERAGKTEQLALVRNVLPEGVRAVFVTQAEAQRTACADRQLRHRRDPGVRWPPGPDHLDGGKARARGCAQHPGRRGALRARLAHLRVARGPHARRRHGSR